MKRALWIVCATLLFALPAAAKDMTGLWGVGYTKAFSPAGSDLSAVSVRYWLDKQLGLEGLFGYQLINRDNGADERTLNLGGRFLIKMVEEENLHVYGGAGLALLYHKVDGDDNGGGGVGAETFAGAEYFFQGLPNLGFSSEVGLRLADTGDTTVFGTDGNSFVNFGIRYYF
ncbi:MAG: hypothetical protein HY900_30220 [Deltaproteobacteria bacterium]|nr:hypothetical protein [Deltaproteobacteria bacterium]